MAIDSSALIAILTHEADELIYLAAIADNEPIICGPVRLATFMVLTGRDAVDPMKVLEDFLTEGDFEFVDFNHRMTRTAQSAFLRYGKGRHPAELNFGDCMSYAAAKALDVPLLYKGDDFARTDIESAMALFGGE